MLKISSTDMVKILKYGRLLGLVTGRYMKGKIYKGTPRLKYTWQILMDWGYNSCEEMKRKEIIGD